MKTKQKIAVPILADREVFDYLKEKVGERKTKTEAFCDLLDKSLAGFVSPFLRNKGYELQPNQCHVTVSDLSSEWHWHRATVRSFLDVMEEFGLLYSGKCNALQSYHTNLDSSFIIIRCRIDASDTVRRWAAIAYASFIHCPTNKLLTLDSDLVKGHFADYPIGQCLT